MDKTREIKSRIKSISGTRKITKAMEMIASSRIRKAQKRILEARPFISKIEDFITDIVCYSPVSHPLLSSRTEVKNILVMGITADRGLCGGYNSNMIRRIKRTLENIEKEGKKYKLDIIGTRGKNHFRYMGYKMNSVYENLSDHPKFLDARKIAGRVIKSYITGEVDEVIICYTRFNNPAEQIPSSFKLLPMTFKGKLEERRSSGDGIGMVRLGDQVCRIMPEFTYEPSMENILEGLLPEYIYTIVYTALLESTASEIGARMTAMKSASDNAKEIIKDLSRKYHRERQQNITIEISEIVSGAEALTEAGKTL
ncbi:MAG: F0F1 ATP synthase subunit gamma [Actinobacteria bacterium]|nr:F0F1 ATP synthase subunit gamma [Actinomycetota bacterium]